MGGSGGEEVAEPAGEGAGVVGHGCPTSEKWSTRRDVTRGLGEWEEVVEGEVGVWLRGYMWKLLLTGSE